jgi:NAD(P)-dependent dehydrogenase (short-subunit alcohol dehydrogenase family)
MDAPANKGHVLITGTSTGIGRACAVRLCKLGFKVLAGVRSHADAKSVEDAGCQPIMLDVTCPSQITAAADLVKQACGDEGLAALINNAGISMPGPVEFVSMADWRKQFDVNFFGQIAVTQAMLPLLRLRASKKGPGSARIVLVSSIAGLIAQPIIGPYNASKYALEAAGDALRLELRRQGIIVCLVEPGAIDTPIWEKGEANPRTFGPDHPARQLYGKELDGILAVSRKCAQKALPADEAARVVEECLTKRRPRTRYLIGLDAYAGAWAKRLLPTRVLDAGIRWALGL